MGDADALAKRNSSLQKVLQGKNSYKMKGQDMNMFQDSGTLRPLRPHMANALVGIREAIKAGHKRIVVMGPTGSGKTNLAAHIISGAVQKGKRPMFTCPAISLIDQTLRSFEAEGIKDIGVIQADHARTDWTAQVQIASVQTLIRRAMPEVDIVIVDEVHLQFQKLNERLDSEEWKEKIVIGLSATPWTKGMGLRWTHLVIASRISDLIEAGYLCPFVVMVPEDALKPDMSKVKTVAGEFDEAGSSKVMSDSRLVGDVVKTWREKWGKDKTFLFAVDRAHAKSLREAFETAAVPCGYIDAFSSKEERTEAFRRFRDGTEKVLASVGCLTTGVDEDVRCIIDASPTKSEKLHVQRIGRGLRTAYGKESLLVLDHAANSLRVGLVTDIFHDRLDTSKPGERGEAYQEEPKPKKPRECNMCHALLAPGARQCPGCGCLPASNSDIIHEEGELVLLGSKPKPLKKEKPTDADKQEWWSGFLGLAEQRNKSRGWASWQYKHKFGVFPRNLDDYPIMPSAAVVSFERSRRIAYAKGMAKQNTNGKSWGGIFEARA